MGIGSDTIELLIALRSEGLILPGARVIDIGAQQLANSFLTARERLKKLGELFGVTGPLELGAPKVSHISDGGLEHLHPEAPPARGFWLWLGMSYCALDIDGSPGSLPLDLNYDSVPTEMVGQFQVVTNFGTTEHVANQLNAFKVVHDLTARGGLMIHQLPAQGMFNHGLVNYNFKFFWMLARSNEYKVIWSDYYQAPQAYQLPQNIVSFVESTNRYGFDPRIAEAKASDGCLKIVMQKVIDIDYVPPIDVPTGARTEFPDLRRRYWTVFERERLERILRGADGGQDV